MSIVAPPGRKHLSADALFRLVHSGFASLPDYRVGDVEIALTDALMSAFAMFALKAPSLLAFDKERAEGNLHTIYGIQRVPCDTHMREIRIRSHPSRSARCSSVCLLNYSEGKRSNRWYSWST